MNVRDLARKAGLVACLATVVVLGVPYAVVSGSEALLVDYYAAGPVGAGGVVLFALLSAVVFASIERGNVDPGTLAGVLVVLSAGTFLLALLWHLTVDSAVVFSFPARYDWIEWHSTVVTALAAPIPVCAGLYARDVIA